MMKRLDHCLPLALLAAALLFASTSARDKFPTGTFAGGMFTVAFGEDGTHSISTDGKVVVKGTYSVSKDEITLSDKEGDYACPGQAGKYNWKYDGKSLTFSKVEDECEGRVQGLTSQPWVKK